MEALVSNQCPNHAGSGGSLPNFEVEDFFEMISRITPNIVVGVFDFSSWTCSNRLYKVPFFFLDYSDLAME